MSRSSSLHATLHIVSTPRGDVEVVQRGPAEAPVLLFLHGALVSGTLWDPLLARLERRYRCVVPDLPLGSHRVPLHPGADLTPPGVADLVTEVMDALGLARATLVGNDSGGAIAQLVAARHPARVDRLVLTNCDAFEVFPPRAYGYLKLLRHGWLTRPLARLGHAAPWLGRLPYTWGPLGRVSLADIRHWTRPLATQPRIARDFGTFIGDAHPRHTLAAAEALRGFASPVRLIWGERDRFFPLTLAKRLVAQCPDARLTPLARARTYVMRDAPDAVAAALFDAVPR
ncbi:MAG: alpha/beta hydrolase [Myxococcota bacterium]